jgi:fibronectin type 3 domain-containing protein
MGVGYSYYAGPDTGNASLAAPTNVNATDGTLGDKVRVTWNAAAGAGYYQVFRATAQNGAYSLLYTTTGTQYDDMQTTTTVYWYKVRSAVGGVGYSAFAGPNAGNAGVNAPAGLTASDGAYTDSVHLSWTAASGAGYYQVWRSTTAGGTYTLLASPTGTSYIDYISGTAAYYYKVRAGIGGVGYSAYAGPDAGNASVAAPTNVAATDGTLPDRVVVTWTAAPGATYYQVWRSTSAGGTYTLLGSATGTQFTNLVNTGTTYYYKVRSAVAGLGYSTYAGPDAGFDGP